MEALSSLYKRKKKLTDAKSLENSADSGFASFCSAKVENNPEKPNNDDGISGDAGSSPA